jgi:hypothetical protein
MARSATGGEASATTRERRRAPEELPPRTRYRTGGSDSWASASGRSTPGSRAPERRAAGRSRRNQLAERDAEARVQVLTELGGCRRRRRWESPDDEQSVRRQHGETSADEVTQPSGDSVAHHRTADGLAHDKSGARRGGPVRPVQMHNKTGTATTSTTPDDRGELVPVCQPGCSRQHRGPAIRRRAARGPCRGGRQRWRDPPACASAAGNRASSPGGGCSAGRCACPCSLVGSPGRQPAHGAADRHIAGVGQKIAPREGARFLTRVRSGEEEGQTAPARVGGPEGVLWRCVPIASVRVHRWIRGDPLRSSPRAARRTRGAPAYGLAHSCGQVWG